VALLAAYNFDSIGGSTVADLSGNGYDITLTGTAGAQVSGGQTGGALGKTGATMPVLPAGLATASQTDDRSLMFDAKNDFTTWWVRWEKDAIGSGTWGVLLLSGAMQFFARRASDDGQMASRPTAATPGTTAWHNYAVTYVRSTGVATFYRDGVSVGTASFTAGTQLVTNADRINIAEWSTTGPALDNLRIYSHALTGTEVAALAGTPVTAAARTGSVTLAATAAFVVSGKKGAAGTVPLAATAALPSAGRKTSTGTAGLAATASTATAGTRASAGGTTLGAVAQLAVSGVRSVAHTVALAASAALGLSGRSHRAGTVTLHTTATLTAGQAAAARDITLTAALAAQTRHTATLATGPRWTATLGAQP
jgi:hypothetical protein